jgi:hypothetical protein
MMHVADGRVVVTWVPWGAPLGLISGKHFPELAGFEVDWILRFPEAPPGSGEKMCADLLPALAAHFGLRWVIVKIADNYKPIALADMAKRFGFVYQQRDGDMAIWRKNL